VDFHRDLSPGEMLGQVFTINRDAGEKVNNVVVMGVGEPFDNYDSCISFIRLLHENPEASIGYRKVTISTCGLIPGIEKLAAEGLKAGLSVSLHAPDDRTRSSLMPINNRYPVGELLKACDMYAKSSGRRVTFEYAMINGVNDSERQARELALKLRGMLCHVNIIPINAVAGRGHRPPDKEKIARFEGVLRKGGVNATVRRVLGADIDAACGQLRSVNIQTAE